MKLQNVHAIYLMSLFLIPSLAEAMKARLVDGTMAAGRLEIYYNGEWGTVCDDGFGKDEATVACRMLGFNNNEAAAVSSIVYGEGSGPMLFEYVGCSGEETSLEQCANSGYYSHDCQHFKDVGVICNITEAMKARLVDGTKAAGRLEIYFNGEWGTVCDHNFGKKEATVACRMLGYNNNEAEAVGSVRYGKGSGPILLEYVGCSGEETSLAQCANRGYYSQHVYHSNDVGVICNITNSCDFLVTKLLAELMEVRLVNGTSAAGRLEIYYNGLWETVCDYGFEKEDALLACRMLGFNSTEAAVVSSVRYGQGSGHILVKDVRCRRQETSLALCPQGKLYSQKCNHSKDVGVICNISEPMKARLVNGTSEAGRLEVFFNGEWSTVCNKGFGNKEAHVACRMLKFNSSEVGVVPTVRYGRGSGHILLSNIWCSGEETSLSRCWQGLLYPQDCDHSNDVGVVCNMNGQSVDAHLNGTNTTTSGCLDVRHNLGEMSSLIFVSLQK